MEFEFYEQSNCAAWPIIMLLLAVFASYLLVRTLAPVRFGPGQLELRIYRAFSNRPVVFTHGPCLIDKLNKWFRAAWFGTAAVLFIAFAGLSAWGCRFA